MSQEHEVAKAASKWKWDSFFKRQKNVALNPVWVPFARKLSFAHSDESGYLMLELDRIGQGARHNILSFQIGFKVWTMDTGASWQ